MIQDIKPHVFNNEYFNRRPSIDDMFLTYSNGGVLAKAHEGDFRFPRFSDLGSDHDAAMDYAIYLFAIDDTPFYLIKDYPGQLPGYQLHSIRSVSDALDTWVPLAVATGFHLSNWYNDNRFCGRCGKPMVHSSTMRSLQCQCGNEQFPKIAPVVLAAIVNGDKIVATRYRGRPYKGLALNAGFVEIGESLEGALRREVEEEVGLKIGKIHYYDSQPWGHTGIVMAGYFVEIQGDDTITMDEDELAEAFWISRDELPEQPNTSSLTATMFEAFRTGKVKF